MARQIPPFALEAKPLTDEAKKVQGFKWADAEVGTRHRLGGDPDFLQDPIWPECPECGERMTFYAQLDSIGDDVCIADCGMVYVFVCMDCNETKSVIQSS
ncbi:YwqG family protein [Paraliomyxa miuraensis]|uniref:hypothetical protein n=1 Tax=Paraliomyxa miuraensis TaxID=376150 RepID=UPI0022579484|nr:hypothetical protein [Paraliomyxa miuraensis]MCX4239635.1 hypothetical protein [Paraliomyxa miuraensis]